jgi:hypothetical protein
LSREIAAENRRSATLHPVHPGNRFGRWLVLDATERSAVTVRCDCGTESRVPASNLVGGLSRSCGCLKAEMTSARRRTHGVPRSDYRYTLWLSLMGKCYRKSHRDYRYYGGRGIRVHEPWHDAATFFADLGRLLGPRPEGLTLDRIDNDGHYEPGNLRWATRLEQTQNRRVSRRVG